MRKPGARPTIREVAELAGVSVTTVSDAMNGKGRVDPDTKARVREAAETVGWTPKRSARALRSGHTGIIAFCLPRRPEGSSPWIMSTDYYLQLAAACAVSAVSSGRFVLLAPGPVNLDDVAGLDVDGAIVVDPTRSDPTVRLFEAAGIPVVTVDRDLGSTSINWVSADNAGATKAVLDHLADGGSERIGLITSEEDLSWLADVLAAYESWCAERGRDVEVHHVNLDDSTAESAALVRHLVDTGELPDALFAVPYGSAVGVVGALGECEIPVPGKVRVAAGVDGPTMTSSNPSITAVDLAPQAVADAAMRCLVDLLEGGPGIGPILTSATLVVRAST